MNQRKIEAREIRLQLAKARVAARTNLLKAKGFDEKKIKRDSLMRSLLAEVRKVSRSLETLRWEPPKVETAAKPKQPETSEKPEKSKKPAKEAAAQKAAKPPKEKKPKAEESAPAD